MLNRPFTLVFICLLITQLQAQKPLHYQVELRWDQSRIITVDNHVMTIPFDGQLQLDKEAKLPLLSKSFPWTGDKRIEAVRISDWKAQWREIPRPDAWDELPVSSPRWTTAFIRNGDQSYIEIEGHPIRHLTDSTVSIMTGIEWTIDMTFEQVSQTRDIPFEDASVLRTGTFYKLRIEESGVYKMDQAFFQDVIGIDISEINPTSIQLYTGEPGKLPNALRKDRIDDLEEIPLWFSGTGNNFEGSDYFLFYALGPSPWQTESGYGWDKPMNVYDRYQYLFLRTDGSGGQRIQQLESVSSTAFNTDIYLDHARYEVDKVNLLGEYISGEGSGQRWFGDIFTNTRSRDYTEIFDWNRMIPDSNLQVRAEFAARVGKGKSNPVTLTVNGNTFSKTITGVPLDDPLRTYAKTAQFDQSFPAAEEDLNISLDFPKYHDYSEGWLDFIQVEGYRSLHWNGTPLLFSHPQSSKSPTASFELSNATSSLRIWDVTDPLQPKEIQLQQSGNSVSFGYETNSTTQRFLAFETPKTLEWTEPVDNQNLHGMQDAEMIIIYHPLFEDQALRLRDHRIAQSGLDVRIVPTTYIYNEFSSGKADPSGIRNFLKMIYDRSEEFKYLLLFGDASYDFRGVDTELADENFVPTFETETSLHPIYAYPTDDYYGLLSDGEGGNLKGALDIAVGRLPIGSADQAENIVDKIIRYETDQSTYGPWRLNLGYAADDGDGNRHLNQADDIATEATGEHPVFNGKKFYLDAYPRETTSGGVRFPQANKAINDAIFQGLLVFNYLGHGGPFGLTQERVLTVNDIGAWDNNFKLPLFITATCTFSPYDDPDANSGGEMVLHNENGGGIALYSTVRAVFSGSNKRLNDAVFSRLFKRYGGETGTLGEIMMNSKNANSFDTLKDNARKFALLGDPAMKLAIPEHKVAVTNINGSDDLYPLQDTLNALEKVTVKGEIRNQQDALIPDFNGTLHVTVFDKAQTKQTLGQSSDSYKTSFTVRNSVIFKGNASVANGRFSFSFSIPQDINYEFGQGKLSLYAYNSQASDAAGHYDQFIIGGSSDTLIVADPPKVEVYMNTEEFRSGGVTNERPTLLAIVEADLGINVTGNSIGHDMVAVLDGEEENKYVLNDYFESDLDDYTKGSVHYPLGPLEEGRHEIEVRAYDIANNVGTGRTEFVVVNNENELIDHIMNYPNPFNNKTYFEIAHNLPPGPVQLDIQIFDQNGKRVSTMHYEINTEGFLIKVGPWDGVSDFGGSSLANGMYYYRAILSRDQDGDSPIELVSETKKMIIME